MGDIEFGGNSVSAFINILLAKIDYSLNKKSKKITKSIQTIKDKKQIL
jgi:hypothetical protein